MVKSFISDRPFSFIQQILVEFPVCAGRHSSRHLACNGKAEMLVWNSHSSCMAVVRILLITLWRLWLYSEGTVPPQGKILYKSYFGELTSVFPPEPYCTYTHTLMGEGRENKINLLHKAVFAVIVPKTCVTQSPVSIVGILWNQLWLSFCGPHWTFPLFPGTKRSTSSINLWLRPLFFSFSFTHRTLDASVIADLRRSFQKCSG